MNPEIIRKCQDIAWKWREYWISQLPNYAFKYEDGDKYVHREFMIDIEKQERNLYVQCLEKLGEYPMPPS
jgi:hypothetical protein